MKTPAADTVQVPDILHCNCLPVRRAARFISRLYDGHLRAAALSSSQFVILALLRDNPRLSMRVLGETLLMERTTLVRALKPLLRDELVRQERAGARKIALLLSAEGGRRYDQAYPYWQAAQRQFEDLAGATLSASLQGQLGALNALGRPGSA